MAGFVGGFTTFTVAFFALMDPQRTLGGRWGFRLWWAGLVLSIAGFVSGRRVKSLTARDRHWAKRSASTGPFGIWAHVAGVVPTALIILTRMTLVGP